MFKDIFLHVQDTLKVIVPAIRFADFDLGQLEQEQPSVAFPCVLVDFGDSDNDYLTLAGGAQLGVLHLTLRIAFNLLERTHSVNNDTSRLSALQMLDTVDAVHNALQGTSGEWFGALDRIAMGTEKRADLRVFTFTYATSISTPPALAQQLVSVAEYQANNNLPATPIVLCNDDTEIG